MSAINDPAGPAAYSDLHGSSRRCRQGNAAREASWRATTHVFSVDVQLLVDARAAIAASVLRVDASNFYRDCHSRIRARTLHELSAAET